MHGMGWIAVQRQARVPGTVPVADRGAEGVVFERRVGRRHAH